jgi:hypothetical protein
MTGQAHFPAGFQSADTDFARGTGDDLVGDAPAFVAGVELIALIGRAGQPSLHMGRLKASALWAPSLLGRQGQPAHLCSSAGHARRIRS